MQVAGATAAQRSEAAASAAANVPEKQKVDYLKLIVAQMRNLNPMDPNSGGDSLPTMMAAESLNQLTLLNQNIKDLQTLTQTSYASGLIGRTVTGEGDGQQAITGVVKGLTMELGGPVLELMDGKRLRLLDVSEVRNT